MESGWKEPDKQAERVIADDVSISETLAESQQSKEVNCLQPGSIFAGHYEILSMIGQGGMSTIYKARHMLVDKIRAIKVIRSENSSNSKVIARFQQEGKATLSLEHPNIVRVYEFGIEPGQQTPYLVMDYVEGEALSDVLSRDGALGYERARRITAQVCNGLQEAHLKGIVHRDIKPANIILTKDGTGSETAKIVDFGITKILEPDHSHNITQTGEVFGTPLYMSPEQCLGQKVDGRSDIYSLGCVLYEMLSGSPPHMAETPIATAMKHLQELPKALNEIRPDMSVGLERIVDRAMVKDVKNRYQSAVTLLADLEGVAQGNLPSPLKSRKKRRLPEGTLDVAGIIILAIIAKLAPDSTISVICSLACVLYGVLVSLAWRAADSGYDLLIHKSDPVGAERAFRKALRLKPGYRRAWMGLATALQQQGKHKESEVAIRQADES
ncbi:MAG: serine/threonine protein kinase [Ktedonobacteraceae bacterium]